MEQAVGKIFRNISSNSTAKLAYQVDYYPHSIGKRGASRNQLCQDPYTLNLTRARTNQETHSKASPAPDLLLDPSSSASFHCSLYVTVSRFVSGSLSLSLFLTTLVRELNELCYFTAVVGGNGYRNI